MTPNEQAVAAVLATYEDALNAPDTEAVMPLYTDDGVFMPPYSQPAIGARRQCAKPMTRCSKVIMLSVKFNITEIVEMSQTGCSRGLIRQERQQTTRPVRRVQKQIRNSLSLRRARKIARYSFSSTNPPKRYVEAASLAKSLTIMKRLFLEC